LVEQGITSMPLVNDGNGFPKRPIMQDWTNITTKDVAGLPWEQALGLGVILGAASSNLAVIDVDDVNLANTIIAMMRGARPPKIVRTIRQRCHIYVIEAEPTNSRKFSVRWDGVEAVIELKTTGTQVAAPPTPGYSIVFDRPPMPIASVAVMWNTLQLALEQKHPSRLQVAKSKSGANFPGAWRDMVKENERNDSLYVEAHRLREAGVPFAMAMQFFSWRIETGYAKGGFTILEAERTVKSAYKIGVDHIGTRPDTGIRGADII
jgi:hypothetical protein